MQYRGVVRLRLLTAAAQILPEPAWMMSPQRPPARNAAVFAKMR
jgi:hypothetical protein